MKLRLNRFMLLAFVGFCILVMCVNSATAIRTRSGSGTLSPDETRESTLIGYPDGRIDGQINATEGPLEIYIIHSDDYVDLPSLNTLQCIVYEHEAFLEFGFDVLIDDDWVLILRNPNGYDIHFEFTWSSYEAGESSIVIVAPLVLPSFLFLLALGYIITVLRGVLPEVRATGTSSLPSAIIGFVLLILSLVLPVLVQLNMSYSEGYIVQSLLWTLTSGGVNLPLMNSTNPYAWIMPMILIGPALLFPFAMMFYYQGRITKRQMVTRGIISIIPLLVITGLGLLTLLLSPSYPLLAIPLPLVFILGLVVSKYIPINKVSESKDGLEMELKGSYSKSQSGEI